MALTQEQKQQYTEELLAYIEELKATGEQGILMPVMQKAQGLFGHLPLDIQVLIADGVGCPVTDVYGVATFYAQFSLTPKGDYIISVCTGTACFVLGAQLVLDEVVKELGIQPGETTADGKLLRSGPCHDHQRQGLRQAQARRHQGYPGQLLSFQSTYYIRCDRL